MRLHGFLSFGIVSSLVAVVASVALVGCSAAPDDESVIGGDSALSSGARGTQLQASAVANLVRQAGFPESVVSKMVCTAYWESNFFDHAINNDSNGTSDHGIFQVNSIHIHDRGCPSSTNGLYDPTANTQCAFLIYKADVARGHDGITAPWAGYRAHKSECDRPASPSSPWNFGGAASGPSATPTQGPQIPTTAAPQAGATAGTCNRNGAFYCGNPDSNLKGDPNTLYHCVSGRMVQTQVCTSGCNISAQGVDDFCVADSSASGTTGTGSSAGTGTGTGTGTDFGAGICAPAFGECLGPDDSCCNDDQGNPQTCVQSPADATQFFCSASI
jgi:hypothetical protein